MDHVIASWFQLWDRYGAACPPLWIIGGSLREIDEVRATLMQRGFALEKAETELRIAWWGCLDPAGVSAILEKSLVLVTNSLYEPGGRMVVEAMCEAVPVIAAPFGFAKDAVVNWRNGFLVDHGDEGMLARRMEHFIRQPFLSSALGHNAKTDGARIVAEWSFFDSHLEAYGLPTSKRPVILAENDDWFQMRKAAIYPLSYDFPCPSPIMSSVQSPNSSYRKMCNCSSDVFVSEENRTVVKRYYQRFTLGPLFNPVAKSQLVRERSKAYSADLAGHKAFGQSIVIRADGDYSVIETKLLEPNPIDSVDTLIQTSLSLLALTPRCPQGDADDFNALVGNASLKSPVEVKTLLGRLEQRFAPYEFASSGAFSTSVAWNIAPMLLKTNAHLLSSEAANALELAIDHFLALSQDVSNPSIIALDLREEHLVQENGKLTLIDLERSSIGEVECELADLLYSFAKNHGLLFDEAFWNGIVPAVGSMSSIRALASAIAYRLFYDSVLELVMMPRNDGVFLPDKITSLFTLLRNMESTFPIAHISRAK